MGNYGVRYDDDDKPRQQVIRASTEPEPRPVPPSVTLEPKGHLRTSNVQRDRYTNWVNQLWSEGRMSDEEHTARETAIRNATVEADLVLLLRDLPPLPETREEKEARKAERKKRKEKAEKDRWSLANLWKKSGFRVCVAAVTFIAGAMTASVFPAFVFTSGALQRSSPFVAGAVGCLVLGMIAFIVGIIWFCVELDNL